ncbi:MULTISPECIES: hypothetical protein [Pseudomonas]|jgi:hypothetical protein|uniref:hypothetical protein n=1 Tax=Pseudomonas TaxID=286 RepID=UPI0012AE8F39|nr:MULTISPECIES: hypothetical protein [Pseudomonas]MCE0963272.1 hypothetical protein [Pseudomonas putida]MCK2112229.1 hypothetical protein [Pseudomonas juntendi]MRT62862.1 hypothetical protein [Pseudomonas sp. CAH-1]QPN44340.1 hypothetical protein I5S86_22815 [Priestia aryabhattai]
MNAMEQFIKAKLLQADLKEIDQQLSQGGFKNMGSMLLVKQSLLTISNLVDLELSVRVIYKQYPILSEIYRRHEAKYRFAKYLRNKFVGHVKQELILKAIEWRPELRYLLRSSDDANTAFAFNLFALETAINTYVNPDGSHQLFESETDLIYPPDLDRFLKYLSDSVRSAINYLHALAEALGESVEMLDPAKQNLEHWIIAAKTKFQFIKK